MKKNGFLYLATTMIYTVGLQAQEVEFSLKDLSDFKKTNQNWKIAGSVASDFTKSQDLVYTAGTGILVNQDIKGTPSTDLYTNLEHGDLELDFDFIMPKESNSGIYLMGRYEIQLYDSWGITKLKHSHCGGIYERWDENRPEGRKGYEGVPPMNNPLRVPGVWNHLKIRFEAPRFKNGVKIKNARIVEVVLNGIIIQQNIFLSGPTRGAVEGDKEVEKASLRIQGDHGPVAFKNIKLRLFSSGTVAALSDVKTNYYEQSFSDRVNYQDFKPKKTYTSENIDVSSGDLKNGFAYVTNAKISIPKTGTYSFEASMNGRCILILDGDTLAKYHDVYFTRDYSERPTKSTHNLKEGIHNLTVIYWKFWPWLEPAFGLFLSGEGINRQALHSLDSYPPQARPLKTDAVPEQYPLVMRQFLMYKGTIITHPAWVGDPSQMHYALNPEKMAFLGFWRGGFLNMDESWSERGGKPLHVLGIPTWMQNKPSVAILPTAESAWPDTIIDPNFKFKGYYLDDTGRPEFKFSLQNLEITDKVVPNEATHDLTRNLSLKTATDFTNQYVLVSEASQIVMVKESLYMIDNSYYIRIQPLPNTKPSLRKSGVTTQLLVPVKSADKNFQLTYNIIW